jgi:hypothetical protein
MGGTTFKKGYWFIGSRLQPESAACTASSAKPYPPQGGAVLAICKQAEELWEKNNKSEGRDQEFYHLAERGLPYREIDAQDEVQRGLGRALKC